jgi:hypothetical protein
VKTVAPITIYYVDLPQIAIHPESDVGIGTQQVGADERGSRREFRRALANRLKANGIYRSGTTGSGCDDAPQPEEYPGLYPL